VTVDDIASAYKTTVSYVRKRASLDRWRKVRLGGRTHYHPEDVDRSLGR